MKISIVIPVYNAAVTLEKCLESVCRQTFDCFEVVCVNDGSADKSLSILERIAKSHNNIKIISKKNAGVSDARNTGISYASGDYITFIDSDDVVKTDYLASLVKCLNNSNCQLVCSGLKDFQCDLEIVHSVILDDDHYVFTNETSLLAFLQTPLNTSPVCKLYDRDIIERSGLRFNPELRLGEDRDFNLRYFMHCDRVVTTSYCGYLYRKDVGGSLTHRPRPKNQFEADYEALMLKKELFLKNNCFGNAAKAFIGKEMYYLIIDEFSHLASKPRDKREMECFKQVVASMGDNWELLRQGLPHVVDSRINKTLMKAKRLKWLYSLILLRSKLLR